MACTARFPLHCISLHLKLVSLPIVRSSRQYPAYRPAGSMAIHRHDNCRSKSRIAQSGNSKITVITVQENQYCFHSSRHTLVEKGRFCGSKSEKRGRSSVNASSRCRMAAEILARSASSRTDAAASCAEPGQSAVAGTSYALPKRFSGPRKSSKKRPRLCRREHTAAKSAATISAQPLHMHMLRVLPIRRVESEAWKQSNSLVSASVAAISFHI